MNLYIGHSKTFIMRKHVCLFTLLFIVLNATAQTGKDPVKVTDMLKIKAIGGINLSADGSKAVFTVARPIVTCVLRDW